MIREINPIFCKESVRDRSSSWPRYSQCSRKVWKDGYCKQHHPDTVAAKRAKWDEKLNLEMAEKRKQWAIQSAAPLLLEAAKNLLADVRRRYPGEELRCPFMIALDEAVKKAEVKS